MNQPIDYLGALQSTFNLAYAINRRLGTKIQITQVKWAFYLHKSGKTRKADELNLANNATSKENLVHIEFSVDAQGFSRQPFGNLIPAFSDGLESALRTCLHVFESSNAKTDGWALTDSQIAITFILDDQNQLDFTGFPRDAMKDVIHKITLTIEPRRTRS